MKSTMDQIGMIIGISTFLGGLLLTMPSSDLGEEDGLCNNMRCEGRHMVATCAGLLWLLSLSVSTYIYLTNNQKEKLHKWNIYILIASMAMTVIFAFVQAIVRIANENIMSGVFIAGSTTAFIIIFIGLILTS